jgi:hypothetical protein
MEYDPMLMAKRIRAEMEYEEPPPDIDAYGYLQGVYQSRFASDPHRVRAARECLPFERPKLAVIGYVDGGSFADRLDRAVERSRTGAPLKRQQPPLLIEGPKPDKMERRI